jgi:hypothetical protein
VSKGTKGIVIATAVVAIGAAFAAGRIASEARGDTGLRTSDGKPDLNGIWEVLNTASWDVQDHVAQLGVPGGQGVVEGDEIPYQPWALEKKRDNFDKRTTRDPETQCYLPGVPRATYMPFPFHIVQNPQSVTVAYEYAHAIRVIPTDGSQHPKDLPDSWMGDSRGRWEGDTLVVDVSTFNDETWFDRAGDFHSDALHVVERFTPMDRDHLLYDVTIEDPKVFSRSWKIRMPLYRRVEKNVQLLDYECVAFLEDESIKTRR